MKKIGITGNIACGKSTAYEIIKSEDFSIIDCDDIVKKLYSGADFIFETAKIFPQIITDNKINLKILSELIFSDKDFKSAYENFIFPKVREKIIEFFKENLIKSQPTDVTLNSFQGLENKHYTFVVVPLLFEAGYENLFDKIIFISSNENIRKERLIARNSRLSNIADKVINSQIPEEEKIKKSDYVIKNNGTLEEFKNAVEKLINDIIM